MKKHALNKWWLLILLLLPLTACADKSEQASSAVADQAVKSEPDKQRPTPVAVKIDFKEGVHFTQLPRRVTPTIPSGKIEVVEMFWYGCPHCFKLEPHAVAWKSQVPEDVAFSSMPAVLNPGWATHARAYYAAEALGLLKTSHETLFKTIHEQGRRINSEDALVRFFERQGVDKAKFKAAMHSPAVEAKVNRAEKLGREYGLTGVPSLIVDGQYRVLLDNISSYEELFSIVDYLVEKVRSDRLASG